MVTVTVMVKVTFTVMIMLWYVMLCYGMLFSVVFCSVCYIRLC